MTSLKNIVVQAGEVGITLRLNANASKDWRPGCCLHHQDQGHEGRSLPGRLTADRLYGSE